MGEEIETADECRTYTSSDSPYCILSLWSVDNEWE